MLKETFKTFSRALQAHCVKTLRIRSFSCPYSSALGLNTERYLGVSFRIQSECGKIRNKKYPNTGTFHAVAVLDPGFLAAFIFYKTLATNRPFVGTVNS